VSNKIAGIDPPVWTTACIPNKKANPGIGCIPKVKGMSRASPMFPPIPGIMPMTRPIGIVKSMSPQAGQLEAAARPPHIPSQRDIAYPPVIPLPHPDPLMAGEIGSGWGWGRFLSRGHVLFDFDNVL
jgi:hypothetical protein